MRRKPQRIPEPEAATLARELPECSNHPSDTRSGKQKEAVVWRDDFDMDLPNAIVGFHRIVGSIGDVKLYTRGSYDVDGSPFHLSCWATDKGLAAYFAALPSGEEMDESQEGPQPEDFVTEDEQVIVSFEEALRFCWLSQCLLMLRWRKGYVTIWNAQRLRQHFDALMHLRRGWGPIAENELHIHQNSVQLSLVNACIAFQRLGMKEGFLPSK